MWKYITTTTALELDMSSFSLATIYEPIVWYLPDREVASPRIACWPRSSAPSRSHREVMRDDGHIDIISYPPPRQVMSPNLLACLWYCKAILSVTVFYIGCWDVLNNIVILWRGSLPRRTSFKNIIKSTCTRGTYRRRGRGPMCKWITSCEGAIPV